MIYPPNQSIAISYQKKATRRILFLFVFAFFYSGIIFSQKEVSELTGKELNNSVRLNFSPIAMPTDAFPDLKPTMGLVGLKYLLPFNDWLYGGAGFHFAVTGDQGGLFTMGAELGVNKKIFNNIYADASFHFGGGGGYRVLVNDGAFYNTNIGLQYKNKGYAFGVQYSNFNFYTGEINDDAISFFVEIPSVLRFTDYKNAHQEFVNNNDADSFFWKKPSVKNVQQVRFDFFRPFGNSRRDNGTSLTNTLYVVGFEYQKFLNEKTFVFAHTDAIYKGLRAGFMDVFFGAGYYPLQTNYFNFFGKLGVGAAGGRIAPEGGLTIYPSAGLDIKLSDNVALSGHGGYYQALDGDFEAYTIGFGIKYMNLSGGTENNTSENKSYKTQGTSIALTNQTYFDVQKTDDPNDVLSTDLQLLGFQFNYDIFKNVYVLGEAGFAYGGRSGGYAHGLVGLGFKSNPIFNNKLNGFINLAGGAAGGAGVDTDEGIVVRPTVGINYTIIENLTIKVSGGKLYSPFGNVNSNNLNVGLSFNFATLLASK